MKAEKYTTKVRVVEAVRVTAENINEVAEWCGGEVHTTDARVAEKLNKPAQTWIKVRVFNPINEKQTQARIGDWVLYANKGYKVFTNASFKRNYEPVFDKPVAVKPNFSKMANAGAKSETPRDADPS